jgi:Transcriptional Coactivator p15 (PC4)
MAYQTVRFIRPIPMPKTNLTSRLKVFISKALYALFYYFVGIFRKMPKTYRIGQNRIVSVTELEYDTCLTILESGSELKSATFSSSRWAQFTEVVNQVDEAVNSLISKQAVHLNLHIGGKWHISVTTGYACVDFRRYYYNKTKGPCPTKTGIALRIPEWTALKELIPQLHLKHPTLAAAQPCLYQQDHQNQEGALSCAECHPYFYEELLHSLKH